MDAHAAVLFQCQAAVAAGIQIGNHALQYFTSFYVIPDLRIDRLLVRRRRRIHTRLHRHDLQEITREIPVAVDLNVRIVIFFNTIHADASGAALHNERSWVPGCPLPAGARIDRFEIRRDPMVNVPQQKLHSVAICLRRTVKRGFPLPSGVVLFLPVSTDGIPRGLKLEHDHPQTPRRKGQEQKRDEPCAAHQRQDRNDHTDQDGDTSPEGNVINLSPSFQSVKKRA